MKIFFILFIFFPLFSLAQIINSVAGGGTSLGDGGPATAAQIFNPCEIVFSTKGDIYVASGSAARIRKIDTSGVITTIAGTGVSGYSGDGGAATAAKLKFPQSIITDTLGNIYFTDALNNVIRRIEIATGTITTICGNGTMGYSGDNGPALSAQLRGPQGICFDKAGNFYIADGSNHVIRKINSAGVITTYAGTGANGYNGDGISATTAQLNYPLDVEVDDDGNIYVADASNGRVRKVNSTTSIISTYAGNGSVSYVGEGMPAINAQFYPTLIKFDLNGELFISDEANYRVYKIGHDGVFYLMAGNGTTTNGGDGGQAKDAGIRAPSGIAFDSCNNLYIGNVNYNRIRKVTFNPACAPIEVTTICSVKDEINIFPTQPIPNYQ